MALNCYIIAPESHSNFWRWLARIWLDCLGHPSELCHPEQGVADNWFALEVSVATPETLKQSPILAFTDDILFKYVARIALRLYSFLVCNRTSNIVFLVRHFLIFLNVQLKMRRSFNTVSLVTNALAYICKECFCPDRSVVFSRQESITMYACRYIRMRLEKVRIAPTQQRQKVHSLDLHPMTETGCLSVFPPTV